MTFIYDSSIQMPETDANVVMLEKLAWNPSNPEVTNVTNFCREQNIQNHCGTKRLAGMQGCLGCAGFANIRRDCWHSRRGFVRVAADLVVAKQRWQLVL